MAPIGKRHKTPNKKVTPSVVVVVTNSRAVALTELDATPSGGTLPKGIVSNLAPGADGSSGDLTSVDLCKDKNVNLIE